MDKYFVTPSFAQVMQILALGFGLAGDRQKKLSEARSFGGKQARYSTHLLPQLVDMLAADDRAIARDLKWRLGQMEYLVSRIRGAYLLTEASPRRGLLAFLLVWVYPHLAAMLNDFRLRVSSASPLYHLSGLLPRPEDAEYDVIKTVKRRVRAVLGDEAAAPDFLRALDRMERDSSKKLSTIEEEVKALGDELRFQLRNKDVWESHVAAVRAVYIAGTAVKRFLDMAAAIDPRPLRAFGACLDDKFDPPEHKESGLVALHTALYGATGFSLESLFKQDLPGFDTLQEGYRELLGSIELDSIEPCVNLTRLFESHPLNVQAVEDNLRQFFNHPDANLLEAVGFLFQGRLALYKGDLESGLNSFKRILRLAEHQQLGEFIHEAAGCAIALEIIIGEGIKHGSLEPLALQRAQSQPQMWELSLRLPTPFLSAGGIRHLPIGTRQVFEAVAEFNTGLAYMQQYPDRQLCNPLARLDGLLAEFFSALAQQRKVQAKPQKAVHKAVTLVFVRRERSVLSIHTATSYQALRDIWSFMSFFFRGELMLHEELNANIQRYMLLRRVMQHRILKALDPIQYRRDMNVAKRFKRWSRK